MEVTADGHSDTTNADGEYTITGLAAGTYTVAPSLTGYSFAPASTDVTVNEAAGDATGIDFTGEPIYWISGTVLTDAEDPNSGLEGVEVTAGSQSGTTNADGDYTISGLVAGTYTVTPHLAEYTFAPIPTTPDPPDITVGPNAINVDFEATRKTYHIGGIVSDKNGDPIPNATVSADGGTDTTDGSGYYQITGLISGTYTVTVSGVAEYTFTPQDATVNETGGNATVNFQGTRKTYSIRGTVTNAGDPLPGVEVSADGTSVATGANGTCEIRGLLAGSYTVTPHLAEYTFEPPEQVGVEVNETVGDAEDIDFVGTQKTYTISGIIVNEQDEPMAGVEVSAGGKSTTTGSDGTYTLEGLVAGTYSVKPRLAEYEFTPSPMNVSVNENEAPATNVNFVGSPKQYTISGTILDWEGNAMSGVEVSANGHSATTDASGEYSIDGPVAGTYTVTPEQASIGFVPDSQEVTVNEDSGDASNIDFTGYPVYTTQLPAGLSLVGVPCQPVTDDLSEVFGTDEVVRWAPDREPPAYLGPGDPGARSLLALEAGKGYFVRHITPQEISVLGLPVPTDVTFELPLGRNWGWNLVANPFPQTLPFSNFMIEASHIAPYGFIYDTASSMESVAKVTFLV